MIQVNKYSSRDAVDHETSCVHLSVWRLYKVHVHVRTTHWLHLRFWMQLARETIPATSITAVILIVRLRRYYTVHACSLACIIILRMFSVPPQLRIHV